MLLLEFLQDAEFLECPGEEVLNILNKGIALKDLIDTGVVNPNIYSINNPGLYNTPKSVMSKAVFVSEKLQNYNDDSFNNSNHLLFN